MEPAHGRSRSCDFMQQLFHRSTWPTGPRDPCQLWRCHLLALPVAPITTSCESKQIRVLFSGLRWRMACSAAKIGFHQPPSFWGLGWVGVYDCIWAPPVPFSCTPQHMCADYVCLLNFVC